MPQMVAVYGFRGADGTADYCVSRLLGMYFGDCPRALPPASLYSADASHQDRIFATPGAPGAPIGVLIGVPLSAQGLLMAQDFIPDAHETSAVPEIPEAPTAQDEGLRQCSQCRKRRPLTAFVGVSGQPTTSKCHDCCVWI